VDACTLTQTVINHDHHEIHAGESFVVSVLGVAADGENVDIYVRTPNSTKLVHAVFNAVTNAQFRCFVREAAENPTDGDVYIPVCRRRDPYGLGVSPVYCEVTPWLDQITYGYEGRVLYENLVHPYGKRDGGDFRGFEWILAPTTGYIFRAQNWSASDNKWASLELNWYEHEDEVKT
jgi:hypothetical protein